MSHDPSLIKPKASYHRPRVTNPNRTLADDARDLRIKPFWIDKSPKPRRKVLPPRSWNVSQVLPIIKAGHAGSPTNAVWLLNLSNLPASASPEHCLLWVETFLESYASLNDRDESAEIADNAVQRIS